MQDFYAASGAMPLDQAHGLRRLFTGSGRRHLALVANPHVAFSGVAIERLTAALMRQGQRCLVVDAADDSPPAPEAAALDLASCVDWLSPAMACLPARGLPLRYVNTRGSSARLLDALAEAVPEAGVVVVHAGAMDLARLFAPGALRPILLAADHPESVKHAYASLKLLAQRCGWLSADLLVVASPSSRRLPHIAATLRSCADTFIGAAVTDWAAIDPAAMAESASEAALARLAAAQLRADPDEPRLEPAAAWPERRGGAAAARRTPAWRGH
jgi:flagellar biosynthesis protein FlhG